MAQHDSHEETNDVRDRVVIPILLPVVALIITVALIVAIGEFLLVFGHGHMIIVGQEIVPQVFAALGLALVCQLFEEAIECQSCTMRSARRSTPTSVRCSSV